MIQRGKKNQKKSLIIKYINNIHLLLIDYYLNILCNRNTIDTNFVLVLTFER